MSTKENKDKNGKKGVGAFIGFTVLSILIILVYFSYGAIFLSITNFYSIFKMNATSVDDKFYKTEFPYKNIFTESDVSNDWLPFRYGNWLTESMAYAFAKNRYYLDYVLNFMGTELKGASGIKETAALIIGPLIMAAFIPIAYFGGIISTWVGAISNISQVIPNFMEIIIMAIPFLIPVMIYPFFILFSTGSLAMGVGLTQSIMMIGFLFIMPFMNATVRETIIDKLLKNKYILLVSLFTLTTINAFSLLGKTEGYVSMGMTIAGLLAYLIMKVFMPKNL